MATKRLFIALFGLLLLTAAFAEKKTVETDTALVTSDYPVGGTTAGTDEVCDTVLPGVGSDSVLADEEWRNPHNYGNDYRNDELMMVIGIVAIVVLLINVGLFILVGMMAKKRSRSVLGWVLLSLLVTSLVTIIILLIIGKSKDTQQT